MVHDVDVARLRHLAQRLAQRLGIAALCEGRQTELRILLAELVDGVRVAGVDHDDRTLQGGDDARLSGHQLIEGCRVAVLGQRRQLHARLLVAVEEGSLGHQVAVDHVRHHVYAAREGSLVGGVARRIGNRTGEQRLHGVEFEAHLHERRCGRIGVTLGVGAVHLGDHALLRNARMHHTRTRRFVHAGTVIPQLQGIGHNARARHACIVEEFDARVLGSHEQVVRVAVHRGEHQALALARMERKGGRSSGRHGVDRAALHVVLDGHHVLELDGRTRAGRGIVVIVACNECETAKEQRRGEHRFEGMFFHDFQCFIRFVQQ